jgi:hypothetical protein
MDDSLRRRQMVRVAALLFGVGNAITAIGIATPRATRRWSASPRR